MVLPSIPKAWRDSALHPGFQCYTRGGLVNKEVQFTGRACIRRSGEWARGAGILKSLFPHLLRIAIQLTFCMLLRVGLTLPVGKTLWFFDVPLAETDRC